MTYLVWLVNVGVQIVINGIRRQTWMEWGAFGPVSIFALLAFVLMTMVSFAAGLLFGDFALSIAVFFVISAVALRGVQMHYPHQKLGLCNAVTLLRAAMVALLAGAVFAPEARSWIVFTLACIAFALDGLDGWIARRSGLTSSFGARFDMEIDALLGAVLASLLLAGGHVGPEILVLGFTRYIFVFMSLFVTKLRADLPESLRRKSICVVQIAALIALLYPLTPVGFLLPISWGAAVLLLWSFGRDTLWLLARGG